MPNPSRKRKTLRQYRSEHAPKARKSQRGADFEDWVLQVSDGPALPEQALWRAVLLQMITDALSNSQKIDLIRYRRDARHWLLRSSRDFRLVCDYAGYNPDWLQQQIIQFLQDNAQNMLTLTPHASSATTITQRTAQAFCKTAQRQQACYSH
jgi:hypothetical protein